MQRSEFLEMIEELLKRNLKHKKLEEKHQIPTIEPQKIIHCKPYRKSIKEKEEINKQVESMQEQDIIKPTKSNYAILIVLIKKPDNSYRFCIDYRKLNEQTIKDNLHFQGLTQ